MTVGARQPAALPSAEACIGFANTASPHASDPSPHASDHHPGDRLTDYGQLLGWSQARGLLSAADAVLLAGRARRRPAEAADVLGQAHELRETLYRVLSDIARGKTAAGPDIARLNSALGLALNHLRLTASADGFSYAWTGDPAALDRMLWPLAYAAGELLTSADLRRLGQCANSSCGWLF